MHRDSNFEGTLGKKLCDEIIALDGTIVFAAIGSHSGIELASSRKPSAPLLIATNEQLKLSYSSLVPVIIDDYKQGESSLGKVRRIVATFENLECVVIPYYEKEAFVVVLTTRDSETNRIAYQVSRLVDRFVQS